MNTALVSSQFIARFGDEFKAVAERAGKSASFVTLPEAQGARLAAGERTRQLHLSRLRIVNEAAMIEALRSGQLGGAALDAHSQEPLPKDSPLWGMPNVIVSPHNASASTGNEKRCAEMFIANFGHWLRGELMFNVQDVSKLKVGD